MKSQRCAHPGIVAGLARLGYNAKLGDSLDAYEKIYWA